MNIIKCAQCGTFDIQSKTVYFGRNNELLGEWPLYYHGASPVEPQNATEYFCGVECANEWFKERRDATQG